ncbi:MAG: pyridoxal phosphate-dependent aminotransferase [Firmicutes bacterium]|nr:pyridoxal phosphate-dependent aminotransferase [Bacillota bacterium]
MKYDFDTMTDRSGTYAVKWDAARGDLPMWVADMDFKTAPEVEEAIVERARHGIYGYTDLPDEWRSAYVSWWERRHGLKMDSEWLVFCTGVVPAISSMVRKLTTPGEKVLLQPPVYNVFWNCIENNGRQPLENQLILKDGRYEMDFEDLDRKLSDPQCSLMILCNPQNPSGRIWTREELAKVGELAAKHGVTVISDEIHCDLCDPGYEYVPFASVSELCAGLSVTCVSPTKTFNLAGINTSAVFASDPRLRHKVWRGINTDDVGEPGAFAVTAAIAAFGKGEPWLNELCAYIAENKRLFGSFLKENIPEIRMIEGHATYLSWLDARGLAEDDVPFQEFLRKDARLFVSKGSAYGAAGKGFLRVNLACPRSMALNGFERLLKGSQDWKNAKRR